MALEGLPQAVFPLVLEAAQNLLTPEISPARRLGLTGGVVPAPNAPLFACDLRSLLLPGLTALGIATELFPLPTDDTGLLRVLRERLRYEVGVPLFAFSADELPPCEPPDIVGNTPWTEPEPRDEPQIVRVGLATSEVRNDAGHILWRDANGAAHTMNVPELRTHFTHLLRMGHGTGKETSREAARLALRRWLAFSLAYPERLPTASDTLHCHSAADWLRELGTTGRSPFATRLRRAAEHYTAFDVKVGLNALHEALVLDFALPHVVREALLTPPEHSIGAMARHELVYLARAGTRDLKVLAAWRLRSEADYSDVRRTFQQLRYDSDGWVRAVATQTLFRS